MLRGGGIAGGYATERKGAEVAEVNAPLGEEPSGTETRNPGKLEQDRDGHFVRTFNDCSRQCRTLITSKRSPSKRICFTRF